MPDELIMWVTQQSDPVLFKLLAWFEKKGFSDAGEELAHCVSRQAPTKSPKVKSREMWEQE